MEFSIFLLVYWIIGLFVYWIIFSEYHIHIRAVLGCDELDEIAQRLDNPAALSDHFAHIIGMDMDGEDGMVLFLRLLDFYVVWMINKFCEKIQEGIFHAFCLRSFCTVSDAFAPWDIQ